MPMTEDWPNRCRVSSGPHCPSPSRASPFGPLVFGSRCWMTSGALGSTPRGCTRMLRGPCGLFARSKNGRKRSLKRLVIASHYQEQELAASRSFDGRVAVLATVSASLCSPAVATTYYVNSSTGSDSNSGRSQVSPWRTLTKVNGISAFQPGDRRLFACVGVWSGPLIPHGTNTPGKWITIGKYGSGPKPTITGTSAGGRYLHQ